jgi:hypothetical protein
MRTAVVFLSSLSLVGCAAVFRGTKDTVVLESNPPGAEAKKGNSSVGVTPVTMTVNRKAVTQLTVTKNGYDEYHGIVNRHMNGWWLTLDIVTCPLTFCAPLVVDAVTGAWFDVDDKHVAKLTPTMAPAPLVAVASTGSVAPTTTAAPAGPPPDMSEAERKATARAAYLAGVALQEKGSCPGAIPRFETAQRYFPAPTHLLHLGQCQAAVGKLVEASETFESLSRAQIGSDASEAFRQARDEGRRELTKLKPRIPTLRIQTNPAPTGLPNLVVKMNGMTLPNEVLGVMRPVNPGNYKVSAAAAGYRDATQSVDVPEGASQSIVVTLTK